MQEEKAEYKENDLIHKKVAAYEVLKRIQNTKYACMAGVICLILTYSLSLFGKLASFSALAIGFSFMVFWLIKAVKEEKYLKDTYKM